ncbi:MAG: acyltransferase [Lachnospiraceae bacterium]|nr:acyltransferase [Lachnospiraceae bacterium]
MPISVYGYPHLMDLSGRVRFTCPVKFGLVQLNVINLAPSQRGSRLELAIRGNITFGGKALIRSNTKIYVDDVASLSIGHNLRLGAGIIINCLHRIEIGEAVRIGHGSQLLDSNLHYLLDMKRRRVAPLHKKIIIGSHCWLTNRVSVYGGAVIPPYSVVASGSLVNKDLNACGPNNILGGSPCRVLASDIRLVNNYERERLIAEYYRLYPDGSYPVEDEIDENSWFINPS